MQRWMRAALGAVGVHSLMADGAQNQTHDIERWKKAVIHLECATDSLSPEQRARYMSQLREQFEKGEIDRDEFIERSGLGSRDIRAWGTAIFLAHSGVRYLVTARHVLWDKTAAERQAAQLDIRNPVFRRLVESRIFNLILRVRSLDEVLGKDFTKPITYKDLDELQYCYAVIKEVYRLFPVVFSLGRVNFDQDQEGNPVADILVTAARRTYDFRGRPTLTAVASATTDDRGTYRIFWVDPGDYYVSAGYAPVTFEDVADGPSSEGDPIFSVGFPAATALLGELPLFGGLRNWSSSYVSLPVFSYGHVGMLHAGLPSFWADISIWPGNSGGPIIGDKKIVGIVSSQATIPIEPGSYGQQASEQRIRILFARAIKPRPVREMIAVLEDRMRAFPRS